MNSTDKAPERAEWLIQKVGLWYRPNSSGYTSSAIQAGRYTLTDAVRISHPNGPDGPRDGMTYLHEEDVIDADWLAYKALAAENEALRAENERLRKLDCEYGRVESTIIMLDPDFDGDSDHKNCGDRLIASIQSLRDRAEKAETEVERLRQFVPAIVIECRGDKCREPWCASCFGWDDAQAYIDALQRKEEDE